MRYSFHTLDVFTERALAGNPLAVVHDADGLDATRMQAIAREFNLSETVFVLTPRDSVNTARVRIFTPARELPFAGHPTVGTAVLLAGLRAPELLTNQDIGIVLEEEIGLVSCTVRGARGQATRASFSLPKAAEALAWPGGGTAEIATALGLDPGRIGFEGHTPALYSAGVPFAFVPVADVASLGAIALDTARWAAAFGALAMPAFVYTERTDAARATVRARMFSPGFGIPEDPATGSAVAALSGLIADRDGLADGDHTILVEQGFEMGRPSLMTLGLEIGGGRLLSASIGGAAVMVSQGTLDL